MAGLTGGRTAQHLPTPMSRSEHLLELRGALEKYARAARTSPRLVVSRLQATISEMLAVRHAAAAAAAEAVRAEVALADARGMFVLHLGSSHPHWWFVVPLRPSTAAAHGACGSCLGLGHYETHCHGPLVEGQRHLMQQLKGWDGSSNKHPSYNDTKWAKGHLRSALDWMERQRGAYF